MTPKQKIEKFIEEGESFIGQNMTSDDAIFISWNNALIRFSEKMYGEKSTVTNQFKSRPYTLLVSLLDTPNVEYVEAFESDMKVTIADLKRLLEELDDEVVTFNTNKKSKMMKPKDLQPIQVNVNTTNNNNNTNVNSNSLNVMSFQEIRDQIEDNTYLDDNSKNELINKLSEIEELCNSKESKSKKWSKARAILAFVLDKGVDIAIMFIPKILEAIM